MSAEPDTFDVSLTSEELQLALKAVQISQSHVGSKITRSSGRQLDSARHEYTTLGNAISELTDVLDVALGVG